MSAAAVIASLQLLLCAALPSLAVSVSQGPCASCEAGGEDASLLSIPRALSGAGAAPPSVQCPGSAPGAKCSGNECCPGTPATGGQSFPCPLASRDFGGCDTGQGALVAAFLGAFTREEKYRFLRGFGWKNWTWALERGYYIGNAGGGLYERYGIPSLNMEDGGQGFRTVDEAVISQVTSWPSTLAIASSWGEEEMHRWAQALGREFRTKGANVILGPGVNVARVARGGRNSEYLSGESPFLGARLVRPYVRGVQSQKVLAIVKHIGNNQQENHRGDGNSIIDTRTMWEVYYPPFEAAVEAGVAAAMCSYNIVNGEHACGNAEVLVKDLKGRMGFKGWVQSDWWALHGFAASSGVDQEMPGSETPFNPRFYTADRLDSLSDAAIDGMVRPQLTMMLRFGLLEPEDQVCQPGQCSDLMYEANATSDEHQSLSRELATKAVLLLKNSGVLPLAATVTKIAVLGSTCSASQDIAAMLGQWDLGDYYNVGGSGRVIAWRPTTIFEGLLAQCQTRGCDVIEERSDDVQLALAAAQEADVAIVCGGATSTEGKDRATLSIDQEAFLVGVAANLTIPVISVTLTPSAVVMPWANDVDAVLNLFFGGKYTGDALADVIFGDANPSAKSPVTFPLSEADATPPCEQLDCVYTEGLFVGWHGLQDRGVLFPFGHGLSYTAFSYASLSTLAAGSLMPASCSGAALCVTARITNSGSRRGVEVAQLYLGFPGAAGEPDKVLRGFVRSAELDAGASVDVVFPLAPRDVQIFSVAADGWVTPDGVFTVFVGASSRDIRLTSRFSSCEGAISLDVSFACP